MSMARPPILDEAPAPPGATATRWDRVYLAVYGLYILVGATLRLGGWWHGDAIWFVWAANQLTLHGSFDMYSLHLVPEASPPGGITYSYSPLLACIIAPFTWLSYMLGGGDEDAYRVMALPLLVFDVLALYQLRRLVRSWWPAVAEQYLLLGTVLTLFLTSFLVSTAYKGHVEGLVLLFLVLALRLLPRHLIWSGVCAGLALAAKHPTALLVLLPIGLVILTGGREEQPSLAAGPPLVPTLGQRLREGAVWGACAVGVFSLILLPAVVTNPGAVYYAFVTLPQNLILLGPGLPKWIDLLASQLAPGAGAAQVRELLLHYSNTVLLGFIALAPCLILVWAARRGQPIRLADSRLWGLMAFNLLVSLVLAKWVAEHYYPLPLLVLFVWDLIRTTPHGSGDPARAGAFPWLGTAAIIGYRSLTQIQTYPGAPFATITVPWLQDGCLFVLFVILTGLVLRGIWRDTTDRQHRAAFSAPAPAPYGEPVPSLPAAG